MTNDDKPPNDARERIFAWFRQYSPPGGSAGMLIAASIGLALLGVWTAYSVATIAKCCSSTMKLHSSAGSTLVMRT